MKYEAFIFDLDGTLVDNMMVHHRIWQQFLENLGISMTIDEVLQTIHGVNVEIIERLFPNQYTFAEKNELGNQKEALYREQFKDEVELIPGARDFLQTLHDSGVATGIGTAAPKENMDFVIDSLQLHDYFQAFVHSGMVSKGKPDPEVFLQVADQLGVTLQNCIVFEDSPTGAAAGSNGGADVVVITTTHTPNEFQGIDKVIGFINDYTDVDRFFEG